MVRRCCRPQESDKPGSCRTRRQRPPCPPGCGRFLRECTSAREGRSRRGRRTHPGRTCALRSVECIGAEQGQYRQVWCRGRDPQVYTRRRQVRPLQRTARRLGASHRRARPRPRPARARCHPRTPRLQQRPARRGTARRRGPRSGSRAHARGGAPEIKRWAFRKERVEGQGTRIERPAFLRPALIERPRRPPEPSSSNPRPRRPKSAGYLSTEGVETGGDPRSRADSGAVVVGLLRAPDR